MKTKQNKLPLKIKIRNLSKNSLFKKLLFTISMLFVYRLGSNIMLTSVNTGALKNLQALDFFSLMTGGNLSKYTLFSMGISPFITSAIVIELLSNDVIPSLTQIKKDGQIEKQNKITNAVGIVIALFQAFTLTYVMDRTYGILNGGDVYSYIFTSVTLVMGSTFLLWIAKQIDVHGISNGSSLIIACGILVEFPQTVRSAFDSIVSGGKMSTIWEFAGLMAMFVIMVLFVVFIESSEKHIPIYFPDASRGAFTKTEYMPIKVNPAGVVPVIFAASIMQFPIIVCTLFNKTYPWFSWLNMATPKSIAIYIVLIALFTFYYSKTIIKPDDISKNFKKKGCSIIGVRPGIETEKYLNTTLNRVCCYGAAALVIVSVVPVILPMIWTKANTGLTVGGTSLIIVTGVTLEIAKKIKEEGSKKRYAHQSIYKKGGLF